MIDGGYVGWMGFVESCNHVMYDVVMSKPVCARVPKSGSDRQVEKVFKFDVFNVGCGLGSPRSLCLQEHAVQISSSRPDDLSEEVSRQRIVTGLHIKLGHLQSRASLYLGAATRRHSIFHLHAWILAYGKSALPGTKKMKQLPEADLSHAATGAAGTTSNLVYPITADEQNFLSSDLSRHFSFFISPPVSCKEADRGFCLAWEGTGAQGRGTAVARARPNMSSVSDAGSSSRWQKRSRFSPCGAIPQA